MSTEPRDWEIARRVCTRLELDALLMRERLHIEGRDHGYRSVADMLGIGWTTARDRIKRAEARIHRQKGSVV